jgi:endonuclease G
MKAHIQKLAVILCALLVYTTAAGQDTGRRVDPSAANIFSTCPNLAPGLPCSRGDIVERDGYALCYSEEHEQAWWVQYELTSDEVRNKRSNRTDDFRPDPLIRSGSASLADYKYSGYDRGHLAPAADMHWSLQSMSESFFMSNMSPQKPGFNRGVWLKLESAVRAFAMDNDAVWVVTGPVLEEGLPTIGVDKVAIPRAYYKVVLDFTKPEYKAIGFILPNEGSREDLRTFAVPVDKVEEVTGLDFFSRLPDRLENELEGSLDISKWSFSVRKTSHVKSGTKSSNDRVESDRQGDGEYWLNTNSNVRHNKGCCYYKNTKHGRFCGPDEGKACGICGG